MLDECPSFDFHRGIESSVYHHRSINCLEMENKETVKETTSRGVDWEVVSLTASAYAASPGLHQFEQTDNTSEKGNESNDVEVELAETSQAMIMSKHFIFPPTEHENLPLEPVLDSSDVHKDSGNTHNVPELNLNEKGKLDGKGEVGWDIGGLTAPYELPGIHFYDEKSNNILIRGVKFEGSTVLQGLNLVGKEQDVYGATKFTSFDSETIGGSMGYDDAVLISNNMEPFGQGLDLAGRHSLEPEKDDTFDESNIPCEVWWKRQVASLYPYAKEANPFCYVFVAAAFMGLAIIGQQWQQERWRVLKLKWQSSFGDADSRSVGPFSRLKAILVGGHRQASSITASGSRDL